VITHQGELWVAKLNRWRLHDATQEILQQQKEVFKLFPNPAYDIVNIEWDEPISAVGNIYSSDGRLIKTFVFENTNSYQQDVNDLTSGLYYIIIRDNSSSKIYKKAFVKL
jgi:hypothetical protein